MTDHGDSHTQLQDFMNTMASCQTCCVVHGSYPLMGRRCWCPAAAQACAQKLPDYGATLSSTDGKYMVCMDARIVCSRALMTALVASLQPAEV